jgi:hypothetical protein
MRKHTLLTSLAAAVALTALDASALPVNPPPTGVIGALIFEDDFERDEPDPEQELIGKDWGTNSKSRAKGQKQVDLDGGAIHITRAAIADHGVSVYHDQEFKDGVIRLRFKIGPGDDLGINLADMEEKSVHAGHLCMARIRLDSLEISDLKTGKMKLEHREARKSGTLTPELKEEIDGKSKKFDLDLAADEWHRLEVRIEGETMTVMLNGEAAGQFTSPGIAHPTKRRLRLAVNREAWVDDIEIWGTRASES